MQVGLIVCGLGNPGPRYQRTRHNMGFALVEHIAHASGARWTRPDASFMACHVRLSGRPALLVKPQTYMNLSGRALRALASTTPLAGADLLVACDDIALPAGQLRLRARGSDGGHNGLKSVIDALGSGDFARLRMGVGAAPPGEDPADYVLAPMTDEQWRESAAMVRAGARCVEVWAEQGIEAAMNRFNVRRERTPPEGAGEDSG